MTQPFTIGVAGLGTVGSGVCRLLQRNRARYGARTGREILVAAISARDHRRDRGFKLEEARWYDDAAELAKAEGIDLIVELIGGEEGIARSVCETALQHGKHVVTANKALIARHGFRLADMAERQEVTLLFEAAVAGGVPILKALREGFAANGIRRVAGILNGTCNYILDQMQRTAREFAEVLAEAQALGYAEADPGFDIDGIDTAHKLAILTALAYGVRPDMDAVYIEGIRHINGNDIAYAHELGYAIKLLGIARPTAHGIEQRVHPCMVKLEQPMARIPDVYNAVELEGDAVGKALMEGRGAGGDPTASAVIADILDIARGYRPFPFGVPCAALQSPVSSPMDLHEGAYYLRLSVIDRPGVLAAVSTILYEENVSLESCIQHGHNPGETVQMAMITHPTQEAAMQKALARMSELANINEPPHMIRIEPL